MKGQYEITDVESYELSVTITMPVKQWREVGGAIRSLEEHRMADEPLRELRMMIGRILDAFSNATSSRYFVGPYFDKAEKAE